MVRFLCCLDGSSTIEAVLVAPPSAEAADNDNDEQQPRTLAFETTEGKTEGTGGDTPGGDGAFQYHDAEDDSTDVFYSARGSSFFHMVNQLPYAPTSTRISGGHRCSLHHPVTLLAASAAIPEAEEEDDTANDNTANKLQPRPTTILREQLVTPVTSTSTPPPLRRSGYPGELSEEELAACLDFRERLRDCNTDPMYRSMVYLNVDIDVVNNNTTKTDTDVTGQGPEGTSIRSSTWQCNFVVVFVKCIYLSIYSYIYICCLTGKETCFFLLRYNYDERSTTAEAFALCRFLRARQFNVDATFAMMDEHLELFRDCYTQHNLWRSLEEACDQHLHCPLELFWSSFPMVPYGQAKNGAFVVYMKAGLIRLDDGLDCLNNEYNNNNNTNNNNTNTDTGSTGATPTDFVHQYLSMAWWVLCYKFSAVMQQLQVQQQAPTTTDEEEDAAAAAGTSAAAAVVLAEAVVIVDMTGLQRSFFSSRTMEFLKQVFGVIQCFPEILNRVVIVNVPYFFTVIWMVLKHFVDPRTVQKIGFFSTTKSAKHDLHQLIEPAQLLHEFGGTDPTTYDQELQTMMVRDSPYTRFILERYNTNDHSVKQFQNNTKKNTTTTAHPTKALQTFELTEKETAILTVYTQAKVHEVVSEEDKKTTATTGTQFVLVSSAAATTTTTTKEGSKIRTRPTNPAPQQKFGQPAAITPENSWVQGPGSFQLCSSLVRPEQQQEKEQYLVVVSIA